jgi:hypothetical protein
MVRRWAAGGAWRTAAATLLVIVGLGSLGVSIAGVVDPPWGNSEDPTAAVFRHQGEPDEAYFRRVVTEVHERMRTVSWAGMHRVPLRDNYLLSALGVVLPSYSSYEYTDFRRGLRRGVGICSQYSLILFDILKRQGVPRRIWLLKEHTVVTVRSRSGSEYVLDPFYGVVVPGSLERARKDPARLTALYAHVDPDTSPLTVLEGPVSRGTLLAFVRKGYGSPIMTSAADRATPQTSLIEPVAYALKWPLAILCTLMGATWLRLRRGRTARKPVAQAHA